MSKVEELEATHRRGQLRFFGEYVHLNDVAAFTEWLGSMRACERVVYAKRPFAGPKAVLPYLSRYTNRVAISNQRLVSLDEHGVTFRWKDYRVNGRTRNRTMTLELPEFARRFLLHVLRGGFHRIRHYGLLANPSRRENLVKIRNLLGQVPAGIKPGANVVVTAAVPPSFVCRHCGSPMIIIEIFERSRLIRAPPAERACA